MNPLAFLVEHSPFDALSAAGRERVAEALEITWSKAGERLLERGETHRYLHVVRKGRVRLELYLALRARL